MSEKAVVWRVRGRDAVDTWGSAIWGSSKWDLKQEVAIWDDAPDPDFAYGINGGLGALRVPLPRRLGEIGEDGEPASDLDMVIGNEVEIAIVDADDVDGVTVFHGRIEAFSVVLTGRKELVQVIVTPDSSMFADIELEGEKAFTDTDPAEMMKWFLDEGYVPGWVWDSDNSALTGGTASYTFSDQKITDIFETIRGLSGPNWYWLAQVNHKVRFNEYAATADHTFKLGLDVTELTFEKDATRKKTKVLVDGAEGISAEAIAPDHDEDHPLVLHFVDERLTDANAAQDIADALLDAFDKVDLRTSVAILDSSGWGSGGHDIESIRPGQVCSVLNPENLGGLPTLGGAVLVISCWDGLPSHITKEVLPIVRIRYSPDGLVLELSSPQPDFLGEFGALSDRFRQLVTA